MSEARTSPPSPEELRQAALDTLGSYADERARQALRGAHVRIEPAVTAWESSTGPVEGHRVTLAVDAATLARLRTLPALEDALHVALASAIASRPGEAQALASLVLGWARDGAQATPDGYRDRPPDPPQTLHEALASYLEVRGEAWLVTFLEAATLDAEAQGSRAVTVTFVVPPDLLRAFRAEGAAAIDALTAAVRDLLGAPTTRVVVEA